MLARMELRQLRYFVAVAETGNISRAAQKIFLTQPALSRQIKALEDELGQPLLERQAHSFKLTPAGEHLLGEARELLQRADEVVERVRRTGRGMRFRVGYAPSLASGLLTAAVENYTQKHPNARFELFDLSTNEMLSGLEEQKLDIALTVGIERGPRGLKWRPLMNASWKVALNRRHPLADRAQLTPVDIASGALLIFCRRDYPEYWEWINHWMREHGQRPIIAGEYDGVNSLMAAVESGLGFAMVTTCTARFVAERVRLKTVSHAPTPVGIAAAYNAKNNDAKPLAVFIEELSHVARGL